MRKIVLLLAVLLVGAGTMMAQTDKEAEKAAKQAEKEAKKAEKAYGVEIVSGTRVGRKRFRGGSGSDRI